jgi:cholinesterase
MRHYSWAIILFSVFTNAQSVFKVGQSVKTSSGHISGQASSWKTDVSEYLGIPFALPPSGNLRWAAPQAIKNASGKVDATKYVSYVVC